MSRTITGWRFMQVDPLAHQYAAQSPYQYSGNNPVMFNDPNGDRYMNIEAPRYRAGYERIMRYASGGGAITQTSHGQNYYSQLAYEMALIGAKNGNVAALEYLGAETIYADGQFNFESNSVTGYMVYTLDKNGNIVGDIEVTIDGFNIYTGEAQQGGPGDGCPPGVDCGWVANVARDGLNAAGYASGGFRSDPDWNVRIPTKPFTKF